MNKNLFLAIALSFLVMIIWGRMIQKFYPVEQQEVTDKIYQIPPQPQPPPIVSPEVKEEHLVSTISNKRELVFSLPSACLKNIIYSQYGDEDFDLQQGFCLSDQDLFFTQERLDSEEAIFVHQDENKRITKHFNFADPAFVVTLDIKIENLSQKSLDYPSSLILGAINWTPRASGSKRAGVQLSEIFLKQPGGIKRLNPRQEILLPQIEDFFGFRNNYFCAIIIPESFPETLRITPTNCRSGLLKKNCAVSQIILSCPDANLLPGQIGHLKYKFYLGPQHPALLKSFYEGAENVIFYGKFDFIAKLLLKALRFLFLTVHNWGWAILILSVAIFFILFPLSLKQMRSAKRMQELQPQIEELRRIYKDNPQKAQKETFELYRREKINPFGGCWPMFLQIPVFFSFYLALTRLLELKGANFLWIKDLSQPDRLITTPEINLLPILMAITMFLQQKFTMMPTAGSSGEQQRLMALLFPVLFGFIFYRMPAGLVLYWFVNSSLMFVYQLRIKAIHEPVKH
jgi:YidC/Oxa1 family membrane protein insertase